MEFQQGIKDLISELLVKKYNFSPPVESIEVFRPKDRAKGDYATNVALKHARVLKRDGMELAQELAGYMEEAGAFNILTEVAKPGFINIFLSNTGTYQLIDSLHDHIYRAIDDESITSLRRLIIIEHGLNTYLSNDRVISIQYIYSRVSSVINYYKNEGIKPINVEAIKVELFKDNLLSGLIKHIIDYSSVFRNSVDRREPELFISYLLKLEHSFYQYHQTLLFRELPMNRLEAILKVFKALRTILKHALDTLELAAPDKM